MEHDGVSVATEFIVASFIIERVKTGIFFLLAGLGFWERTFPDPSQVEEAGKRLRAARNQKKLDFTVAGVLVFAVLLFFPELRFLKALEINESTLIDFVFTWFALTTGADQLGELLGKGSKPEEVAPKPIEITGDLRLIGGAADIPHASSMVRAVGSDK
jgi:hypothetical protein